MGMDSFDCSLGKVLAYACNVEQSSCETAALQQRHTFANLGKRHTSSLDTDGESASSKQSCRGASLSSWAASSCFLLDSAFTSRELEERKEEYCSTIK